MKKKRIKVKQIKFMINIICLAMFCFSYLYIYRVYTNKTEDVYKEAEVIKAQMKDRERKLSEEDTVRDKLVEVNNQKQAIIDNYPVCLEEEDNFMFVEQMEKELRVKTSSIATSDNTVFYSTILPAQNTVSDDGSNLKEDTQQLEEITVSEDRMTATYNTLNMSFVTNYNGFKEMVDYIRDYPNHTIIESVAVSYDSSTGALAGSMILKRFALMGTGKEYKAPSIDGIDIGIDNIFGTGNKKEVKQNTETQNSEIQ